MKLVVDDDPNMMRKRFTFLVDHQELVEYGHGIPHEFLREGGIATALIFLIRLYMSMKGGVDAGLRVRMHEMQTQLRAGEEHRTDGQASAVPQMLPSGEEEIVDAEFTDESWDQDQEDSGSETG